VENFRFSVLFVSAASVIADKIDWQTKATRMTKLFQSAILGNSQYSDLWG
jgi:hypothetical protein